MIDPELPLKLTQEQKRSQLWIMLTDHWQKKLNSYRQQNDGDKDERTTANLRGRIAEIKSNLLLGADFKDNT